MLGNRRVQRHVNGSFGRVVVLDFMQSTYGDIGRLADDSGRQFAGDDAGDAVNGLAVDGGARRRLGHAAAAVGQQHLDQHMADLAQAAALSPAQRSVHGQPKDSRFDLCNRRQRLFRIHIRFPVCG